MGLDLRAVRADDEVYLLELYASTREAELSTTSWTEAQKSGFVRMQFDAQRSDYQARFPNAAHSLIHVDGRAVGRVWIDLGPEEIRLLDITVHPDERNRGIGSNAIGWMQHQARAAAVPLRHSVYTTNEAALRFYHRHGFRVVEDFGAYVLMEWLPESVKVE